MNAIEDMANETRDKATAIQVELRTLLGSLQGDPFNRDVARQFVNVALEHAEQVEEGLWIILELELERIRVENAAIEALKTKP